MEITQEINVNNLLTAETKSLFDELSNKYKFEILRVTFPKVESDRWECNINDNEVQIKTFDSNNNIEFFTHELLHVYLDSKGFVDNKIIYGNLFYEKGLIQYFFQPKDIGHINNVLAHEKMMPIFLQYEFQKSKFISDFNNKIDTVQLLNHITSELPKREIPNSGITVFVCQFFTLKFPSNDTFIEEYSNCLQKFSEIDIKLFNICETVCEHWKNTTDFKMNYNLFKDLAEQLESYINEKKPLLTAVLQKRGGACFYDSEVLNSTFVHLMKFSAKNPRLRKAAMRYMQLQ